MGTMRVYDLTMTHQLDTDAFFLHRVQFHCGRLGLSFFLIEPLWAEAFLDHFVNDRVWTKVLLNMHSEHHLPDDLNHRLIRLAEERAVKIIDPLSLALAAFDKASLHPRLVARNLPVPYTVVTEWQPHTTPILTADQRLALGNPFVIKPALGYGRRGVILDATGPDDIHRSAAEWTGRHYLFQRKITPRQLGSDPAYFRVFYVFGAIWLTWWNCYTDTYRLMTAEEETQYQLSPLRHLVHQLSHLTGMRFFSSEIAQETDHDFVLVDYVNDQCHMLSQNADPRIGVPDILIENIARRLVEAARDLGLDNHPQIPVTR